MADSRHERPQVGREGKGGVQDPAERRHWTAGHAIEDSRGKVREATYRMTNLVGRKESTGNKAKQMTKHARAARLQAPKTSMRSHRLTVRRVSYVTTD